MNIILGGMPGSGKTTVSKLLSKLLNMPVYDTDSELVAQYGAINAIFAEKGEQFFRDREAEISAEFSRLPRAVIATGGGCLLRAETVKNFKENGKIVYLKATEETLYGRVKDNLSRPLLVGDNKGKLKKLLKERAPIYEAAADFTVETDSLTPNEVAEKIAEFFKGVTL